MANRYLIFQSGANGLGHVLVSIINCASYALRHGRKLALDMHEFGYFASDAHIRFFDCFSLRFPQELEIITDLDRIAEIRHLDPRHGQPVADVVLPGADSDLPVLFIPGTITNRIYPLDKPGWNQSFHIDLAGELLERSRAAARLPHWSAPVIGLYFRHGNGEFLDGRFDPTLFDDYQSRYEALKAQYVQTALAVAKARGWRTASYFACSDNSDFIATMQRELPNCFTLSDMPPDLPHEQLRHVSRFDISVLSNAVNDVWGLSSCDYLLYSTSLFAELAILNSRKLSPANTRRLATPSMADIAQTGDPEQAVRICRAALARHGRERPQNLPGFHHWLAVALTRAEQPEEARLHRRRKDWAVENWDSLVMREAAEHEHRGEISQAAALIQRDPGLAQHNPYIAMVLARLLMRLGDVRQAEDVLRAAMRLDDGLQDADLLLSRILQRARQFGPAIRAARRAVERDPDNQPAQQNLADLEGNIQGDRVRVNVALGQRATQSSMSVWSRSQIDDAAGAVTGVPTGVYGFHTDLDEHPWWMVDLGRSYALDSIVVLNRGDNCAERARTLCVDVAETDTGPWTRLHAGEEIFGGINAEQPPLELRLNEQVAARLVRLSLQEQNYLHLDQVAVYAMLPVTEAG